MVTLQTCQALESCQRVSKVTSSGLQLSLQKGARSPESYLTDDLSGYLRFAGHIIKPTLSSTKVLGYHRHILHSFCTASIVGNYRNIYIWSSKSLHLEALLMFSHGIPYLPCSFCISSTFRMNL